MSNPLSKEELLDSESLCQYCKWTDRGKENNPTVACYGGEPVMCEGDYCDDAYEYYLDNFEEDKE